MQDGESYIVYLTKDKCDELMYMHNKNICFEYDYRNREGKITSMLYLKVKKIVSATQFFDTTEEG